MKPVNKHQLLDHLEASVERHLHLAIYHFQNQPVEVLLAPSVTGGWSMAQCLEHLNRYGDFYLPAMMRALDLPQVSRIAVMPIPETGLGLAINDRLRRAAADDGTERQR